MTAGTIEGVPTAVSAQTEYTVTAVVGGVNARAVLALEVLEGAVPSNISIKTRTGESGADMKLQLYTVMEEYKITWDGPKAMLFITPELPAGVVLEDKVLKGPPAEEGGEAVLHDPRAGGRWEATLPFAITVSGCEFGHTFYTELSRKMDGDLYITSAQGEVFQKANVKEGLYGAVICLPPRDDYVYHFFCRGNEINCLLKMVREDDTVFMEDFIHMNTWLNTTFVMTATQPPVLETTVKSVADRVGKRVVIEYSLGGVYRQPTIAPELPAGVVLDLEKRVVRGDFAEKGVFVFTLTSRPRRGQD